MTENKTQNTKITRMDFIKNHPELSTKELAEIFSIAESTVYGYTENNKAPNFEKEELQFIEKHLSMPAQWIAKNKPGPKRTINSINNAKTRIKKTNGTKKSKNPWTKEEIDFIKSNMNSPTPWIIENKPGPKRTSNAICAMKTAIRKNQGMKQKKVIWTKEEIDFIKNNTKKSAKWIACNKPGPKRTATAVRKKKNIHDS